ncbi:hypothetical protein FA95DRAFT_145121 [Auriscalpium vulgare]|uniref:Uncharacterized protein n=1 Tax=Auriscalpium vulgare TaxID=40419 RepID=A0ACB8S5W5_9AGAM|nr:hypothetical protein FA95DRAFT_145121 [Auriscalpium vulgare]
MVVIMSSSLRSSTIMPFARVPSHAKRGPSTHRPAPRRRLRVFRRVPFPKLQLFIDNRRTVSLCSSTLSAPASTLPRTSAPFTSPMVFPGECSFDVSHVSFASWKCTYARLKCACGSRKAWSRCTVFASAPCIRCRSPRTIALVSTRELLDRGPQSRARTHRMFGHSQLPAASGDECHFRGALRALPNLQLVTATRRSSFKILAAFGRACHARGVEFATYEEPRCFQRPRHVDWEG